jgi:glycosyltransferase involved in cell wall biosynthesis
MNRIALDTNGLFTTRAGVARHIRGLLKGLQEIQPPDMQVSQLAWPVENFEFRQPWRAFKTLYRELVWANWTAPGLLRRLSPHLLHITAAGLVIRHEPRLPEIVTLHDLALFRHPERYRPWQRCCAKRNYGRLHRAHCILCISQFTADEAMHVLHLPARKLRVVHNGCDFLDLQPALEPTSLGLAVPSEFFLFVGSLEPGKNLALLREAYRLAQSERIGLPPLLIVGARWPGVGSEGPPPPQWHYLGHLPDPVLIQLYRRAVALLFPSKYEGFGFPVVEAMSQNCPVVCSRVASLPEIGGDAVCYADLTPAAYLAAMRRICTDLAWRDELIEKGRGQCRQFTWTKCAEHTVQAYRDVLNPSR